MVFLSGSELFHKSNPDPNKIFIRNVIFLYWTGKMVQNRCKYRNYAVRTAGASIKVSAGSAAAGLASQVKGPWRKGKSAVVFFIFIFVFIFAVFFINADKKPKNSWNSRNFSVLKKWWIDSELNNDFYLIHTILLTDQTYLDKEEWRKSWFLSENGNKNLEKLEKRLQESFKEDWIYYWLSKENRILRQIFIVL